MSLVRVCGWHRAVAAVFAGTVLLARVAHAQDHGEEAYNAWSAAFLVKHDVGNNKGMTFFAKALTGPDHNVPDDNWRLALDIMVVQDAYVHTGKADQRALIDTLLSDYIQFNGTDYSGDNWNDDLGWIAIAFVRGYQLTGQQKYLDLSAKLWNLAYDRGWDTQLGGGIWENKQERPGKEALSNDPFIIAGVALYEATKDASYLSKATAIYAWVRQNLFDAKTGQVNQGLNPPNTLSPGGNVYNSGTFIIAANDLYRITGTTSYRDDAQKAIDYVMAKGPILRNSDNSQNGSWAYWFVKGLSEFCTANGKWDQYEDYLEQNAQSSWAHRDLKTNLTGNDWAATYTFTDTTMVGPMPSDSGVAIWMMLEPTVSMVDAGVDAGGAEGVGDAGTATTGPEGGVSKLDASIDSGTKTDSGTSEGASDAGRAPASTSEPSSDHDSGCSLSARTRGPSGLLLGGLGVAMFLRRRRARHAARA